MAPQDPVSSTQQERSPALVSVDGRTYPLRSAHIRGSAEGGLAQSTLVQVFHNPYAEPLEVLYTMPLPADGAVLGYTVRIGERVIRGEIQPRAKAEAEYKKALFEGRSAGLLEQDRADTFQQRLGNVPPQTDVAVEVDVLHPLAFLTALDDTGPLWEYRFPTVVSVRYQGAPGRVPDQDRLDVDRAEASDEGGIPTRFGVSLSVADDVITRGGIVSPSHEIQCVASATGVQVTLSEDARLDRDLVLRWAASLDEVGVRLVEGKGLPGDDGRYALLTITPPKVPTASFARDLTALIDASGSMGGEPIETAKQIVVGLLESLGPEDRFEIIAFANRPRELTRGVESASPQAVARAIREVQGIRAEGGTEMMDAVMKALAPLRRDSQRQIVLVTDGQIGFEQEIAESLGRHLPSGVRVHAIGIGSAVNRTLTTLVSRAGRGLELIAGNLASADETTRRIRAGTVRPILTDLHFGGSALVGIAPRRPRDVFAGQPLVLAVELKPEGGELQVNASLAGSEQAWVWRLDVSASADAASSTTLPIGALYGREAIADVETIDRSAHYRTHRHTYDHSVVDKEIERLGMRHLITSRFTSLVAIAEEPSVDPLAPRRREKLALEIPHGVSAEGLGLVKWSYPLMGLGGMDDTALLDGSATLAYRLDEARGVLERGIEAKTDGSLSRIWGMRRRARSRQLVAELLWVHGPELALEVEVPEDGFVFPGEVLDVTIRGGGTTRAVLVPEKSSHQGPHARKTRVRLTLRTMDDAPWPGKGSATIEWGFPAVVTFRLVVKLDSVPREKAGR